MMAAKKKGRRKAPPPIDLNEELRKREYVGQREGEELAKCLNQADLDDPLVQLVEDMHAFQAGQVWKAQEIVQAINDAIGRLRIGAAESHGFDPQEGGFTWKQMPTSDPEHVRQSFAWTLAITLHKLNLLGRMRRCAKPDCQKWFFAVLPTQTFHSEVCRLETMTKDPKFKKRRAQYMKIRRGKKS
jgi:hypothetical protein